MIQAPVETTSKAVWASRVITAAVGAYALVGGLISFSGWAFDIHGFTDWDTNGISIQPNATIATIAAGAALILMRFGCGRRHRSALPVRECVRHQSGH
jgi:hypothetical protein